MGELEFKIQQWFLERWENAKKGAFYSIDEISKAIGRDKDEIVSTVNLGIRITNIQERRWQNVVFANNHHLALDTEDVVRACLAEFLRAARYTVIGKPGYEIDFKNSLVLRKVLAFAATDLDVDIDQYFTGIMTTYGIDLAAFKGGKALIIEAKGVTAAKSDFNETIFQMLNRYERMAAICTEDEITKVDFACAFPYFQPTLSRNHYSKQFLTLDSIWRKKESQMLYQFAAATNIRKSDGVARMRPYVEGKPNICRMMDSGKIRFLLIESTNSVSAIGGKPSGE